MGCIFFKCGELESEPLASTLEECPPTENSKSVSTELVCQSDVLCLWKGGGIAGLALETCDESMYTGVTTEGQHSADEMMWWGSHCRAGSDRNGRRKENQDCFGIYDCKDKIKLFCVLDGHGPCGAYASQFVRDRIPETMSALKNMLFQNPEQALMEAFKTISDSLRDSPIDCEISGSTVVLLLVLGEDLYIANVGDSRAVLGTMSLDMASCVAIDLSVDHKPDLPEEEERILSSGGRVSAWGVARVWKQESNTPGIAMSRSMGDDIAQSIGVISVPSISHHRITHKDQFLVLATDGVWEFMSSEECIHLVYEHAEKHENPQLVCDVLLQECVERWEMEEDVVDDTTIVVIFFPRNMT